MFGFSHRKRQRRLPAVQRMGGRKNTMPGRIHMSSHKKPRPADAAQLVTCTTHAGGFSVWHVCASNVRVYPGGLLLNAKTFRNPVLKMWVKKGLLSYRAGI